MVHTSLPVCQRDRYGQGAAEVWTFVLTAESSDDECASSPGRSISFNGGAAHPASAEKKSMAIIESQDKDYSNIINYNVTSMSWRCCQTLLQWVSTHIVLHHQASQKALDTSQSWQDQEEASSPCCRYCLHLEVGSSMHLCSMLYW